jgi:hypothetical protein
MCCFHRSSGYHVRVFTQYQMDRMPDGPNPRGIWGSLDKNTVVVIVSVCWARGGGGCLHTKQAVNFPTGFEATVKGAI